MVDRLGTLVGFLVGSALLVFGIAWPDYLSNVYLNKVHTFEVELEALKERQATRAEIAALEKAHQEYDESWQAAFYRFLDLKSILLVLGGSYAATLIAFPFRRAVRTVVYIAMVFARERREEEFEVVYKTINEFADYRFRNELIPDEKIRAIPLYFLRDAMENFIQVDWVSEEMVQEIISSEIENFNYVQDQEVSVMEYMGRVSPAFGMLGTVVGLILLMGEAAGTSPSISGIMGAMSVALITTLYGVLLSQLIFLPVGARLTRNKESYIRLYEMILEGTIYLHRRERPDVIEQDMQIYLSKKRRLQIRRERAAAAAKGEFSV
jgi:chemotaxis protein MotA